MNAKAELKKLMASSPSTVVTIHRTGFDEVTIAIGEGVVNEAVKAGKRAISQGKAVQWADGTKQWETAFEVVNPDAVGSDVFTWKSCGEKILHNVFLVTRKPDGSITKEHVRNSWRVYE